MNGYHSLSPEWGIRAPVEALPSTPGPNRRSRRDRDHAIAEVELYPSPSSTARPLQAASRHEAHLPADHRRRRSLSRPPLGTRPISPPVIDGGASSLGRLSARSPSPRRSSTAARPLSAASRHEAHLPADHRRRRALSRPPLGTRPALPPMRSSLPIRRSPSRIRGHSSGS